jgi:hypothetical protein
MQFSSILPFNFFKKESEAYEITVCVPLNNFLTKW